MTRKRVVIIGGGFEGMTAARFLRDAEVVLIDRTNHHVFQPLLYQVATAALSPPRSQPIPWECDFLGLPIYGQARYSAGHGWAQRILSA